MDINAFNKVSYGVYIATSKFNDDFSGCVITTLMQITAEDKPKMSVAINKANFTNELVRKSKKVNVSVLSSTASILIIEDEPGIAFDISKMLSMLAPVNKVYQHDNIWHDGNAYSHLRASILGNSVTLSMVDGGIQLDSFQKIVLIDFDNKPRKRDIVVSVIY